MVRHKLGTHRLGWLLAQIRDNLDDVSADHLDGRSLRGALSYLSQQEEA